MIVPHFLKRTLNYEASQTPDHQKTSDLETQPQWHVGALTQDHLEVFCPEDLRAYIAERTRSCAYVLANNLPQPLGYDAVEKAFWAWRATLGEEAQKYTLHGLRKLAIIRLAEAGCSDAEIQAVTNQSAEMVAYYRQKASRLKLSRNAQERRT